MKIFMRRNIKSKDISWTTLKQSNSHLPISELQTHTTHRRTNKSTSYFTDSYFPALSNTLTHAVPIFLLRGERNDINSVTISFSRSSLYCENNYFYVVEFGFKLDLQKVSFEFNFLAKRIITELTWMIFLRRFVNRFHSEKQKSWSTQLKFKYSHNTSNETYSVNSKSEIKTSSSVN